MTTDTSDDFKNLVDRTEAALEKYKERAEGLKEEVGDARAAAKVRLKAMIARLEKKYDGAQKKLADLKNGGSFEELSDLHEKIVSELADMKRTIKRRIR